MLSFFQFLREREVPEGVSSILLDLAKGAVLVADAMRVEKKGYAGRENVHGEKQLKLDVYANDVFVDILKKNASVSLLASEEMEEAISVTKGGNDSSHAVGDAPYAVAFDPLDGSSLVDVNLAVGSIFGLYRGTEFLGKTGREQVAAMIVVYGPRLTFLVSTGRGVDEFLYHPETNEFVLNNPSLRVAPSAKMFAPGNLRASVSEEWYVKLLNHWVKEGYTLRYSGGMVPDVNQILRKGGGVFTYPGYREKPQGKLRLLYECAPMAFLMEQAGGRAVSMTKDQGSGHKNRQDEGLPVDAPSLSDPKAHSFPILDLEIRELHQKTPIFLGSADEVALVENYFAGGVEGGVAAPAGGVGV